MQGDDTAPVRRRRWAVAAVGVALVVAASVVLPRLLADERTAALHRDRDRAPPAWRTPDVPLESLDEEDASTARWVRFCPLADEGRAQAGAAPAGRRHRRPRRVGGHHPVADPGRPAGLHARPRLTHGPTGLFRVELGLADGRVAELAGDTGCSTRDATLFSQLETTLLMDAAGPAGAEGPASAPVTCPDRLTATRTNREGASADRARRHRREPLAVDGPAPADARDLGRRVCLHRSRPGPDARRAVAGRLPGVGAGPGRGDRRGPAAALSPTATWTRRARRTSSCSPTGPARRAPWRSTPPSAAPCRRPSEHLRSTPTSAWPRPRSSA